MQLLIAAVAGSGLLSFFPVLASAQCTGFNGAIAAALSGYPLVQNYCSSAYPVEPRTNTVLVRVTEAVPSPGNTDDITAKKSTTVTVTSTTTSQLIKLSTITDVSRFTPSAKDTKPTQIATAIADKPCVASSHAPIFKGLIASIDSLFGAGCECIQDIPTVTITSTVQSAKTPQATSSRNYHQVSNQNVMGLTGVQRSTKTITKTVTATETTVVSVKPAARCESDDDCSGSCFCDARSQDLDERICWTARSYCLGGPCESDFDCPGSQVCAAGGAFSICLGGSACVDTNKCKSTFEK